MKYTYTFLDKSGKKLESSVDASSKQAALDALNHQGIHPFMLKELSGKTIGGKFAFGNKVKLRDIVMFTRQLSTMVSAGVPLTRSLATMKEQTDNKYFKTVITDITKQIEGGHQLADALAKYPRVFNDVYVNMVRAGEAGGILDEILKRLATQVEQDASIRKK